MNNTIIEKPITGQEYPVDAKSPYAALVHFYQAFNSQDFEKIKSNWMQTGNASMSNPLGGIKRGWGEIEGVYRKIFSGPAKVYVEFYDYSIHATDEMFVAVGREKGTIEVDTKIIDLAIRTSRVYCLCNNRWKQLHHHGSMDNPDLLAAYQTVLLNY